MLLRQEILPPPPPGHPPSPRRCTSSPVILMLLFVLGSGGPQASFTGSSGGPSGVCGGNPSSMDWKLVWTAAPYWPGAGCLPHLLVDLDSWFPQVFQAEPLHVKHHQHRLNLPAQLHGTTQRYKSDNSGQKVPARETLYSFHLPATPARNCPQGFSNRLSPPRG